MGCNYPTFGSSHSVMMGGVEEQTITLTAGDQGMSLKNSLKDLACAQGDPSIIPLSMWNPLDLRGMSTVKFYLKDYGTQNIVLEIYCDILDMRNGIVYAFFPIGSTDGLLGYYQGICQCSFDSGRKVTVSNYIVIYIREGLLP